MPFLPPNQQRQGTEGKIFNNTLIIFTANFQENLPVKEL